MKTVLKLTAIAAVAMTLVACGGGGGGGSISAPAAAPAPAPVPADVQHLRTTLGNNNVTLGTPDVDRPTAATATGLNQDVRDAQVAGWTGKGVKILVVDTDVSVKEIIRKNTTNNLNDIAINNSGTFTPDNNVKVVNTNVGQDTPLLTRNIYINIGAVNTSPQYTLESSNGINMYRDSSWISDAASYATYGAAVNSAAAITTGLINDIAAANPNAVIVKAGGNNGFLDTRAGTPVKFSAIDSSDATYLSVNGTGVVIAGGGAAHGSPSETVQLFAASLWKHTGEKSTVAVLNSGYSDRVIAVGALKNDGTIADYSNTPGANADFQAKWVVANGTCQVATCAATDAGSTAYAAARVSSYAAIVQHKFQGLTAQNTANIIINTADKTFAGYRADHHGQGEANLARALAPRANLR